MIGRLALALLALAALTREPAAETLTMALSTEAVQINSDFTGTNLTVFGVVERDAATVGRGAGYQIAVVLTGPRETVVERRKDRILGIWVNNASRTYLSVPSFYALTTSTELAALATPEQLRRQQIGFGNIDLIDARPTTASESEKAQFREAFLRLKQQEGLYSETVGVDFIGDNIFRATLRVPANVPVGYYTAKAMLFADGTPLNTAEGTIRISKTGFEQLMFATSRQHALLYGLATVLLALFTGWLAGVVFRRD